MFSFFFLLFCRIDREIEDLETEEMNISTNEELILKRLKEVERTAEDIIKVLLGLIFGVWSFAHV